MIMGRPCLIGQLWSRTEGKPAVRNLRGDRGDVGIIRSPVRASILPNCSYPLSPSPGNPRRSCDGPPNSPEPVDQSKHWPSRKTMVRLATLGWDVGVVLTGVSVFLLVARIVGHVVGFKWRW